jgi:hypothetical protein
MDEILAYNYSNPEIPDNWEYGKSVKKVKKLVIKWKSISVEILHELYVAKQQLSFQGVRNDLKSDDEKEGWENYLNETGLSKETVRRWLKQYNPEKKIIYPQEIERNGTLKSEHKCPNCNYEW